MSAVSVQNAPSQYVGESEGALSGVLRHFFGSDGELSRSSRLYIYVSPDGDYVSISDHPHDYARSTRFDDAVVRTMRWLKGSRSHFMMYPVADDGHAVIRVSPA
jgi:hypothetical protein